MLEKKIKNSLKINRIWKIWSAVTQFSGRYFHINQQYCYPALILFITIYLLSVAVPAVHAKNWITLVIVSALVFTIFLLGSSIKIRRRTEDKLKKHKEHLEVQVQKRTAELEKNITKQKQAESKLKKQQYFLEKAQEIGRIGTWELDIKQNRLTWTDETYKIFRLPPGTEISFEIFINCIHPDDREYVQTQWEKALKQEPYDINHRILADGKIKWVREKAELEFNEKGECIRGIGFAQDITDQKQAEEKIKASLQEKEVLLKEIHHRVKNNMQVISSLLQLQTATINDEKTTQALMDCQGRVRAMAFVHETLYSSDRLTAIDFKTYISRLADKIYQTYHLSEEVTLSVHSEDINLGIEQATPLGLIVHELVSNSLKYAFSENRSGKISITFQHIEKDMLQLVFKDNGTGLPRDFDWRNADTLGLQLVVLLAENQLDGTIDLVRDSGAKFIIKFRLKRSK